MKYLIAVAALLSGIFLYGRASAEVPADAVWIDVRTAEEFNDGHLESARHIPYDVIGQKIPSLGLSPDHPIYVYCRSGNRSGIAKESLEKLGYTAVTNAGGLEDARAMVEKTR